MIRSLNAEHETVILVPDLVPPAAEAAAGEDVFSLELREQLGQNAFALEGRGRVSVVEGAVVGRHDLVFGAEHLGVHEAGDVVAEHVLDVDGLHARLGDFEHDAPVRTGLLFGRAGFAAIGELHRGELLGGVRLVVRAVVGEDGGAVKRAVVFREVKPALISDPLWSFTADAYADDVRGAVEEAFAEGDELLVAHHFDEGVDGHGVDKFFVVDGGAVAEEDAVAFGVDALDAASLAEAGFLLGNGFGELDPDVAGAAVGWEAEGGVGAPVAGGLFEDGVLHDELEVRGCHSLAEPGALHLYLAHQPILPHHIVFSSLTFVVGTAHTLKLYGRMKQFANPSPCVRRIHSSKSFGFVFATLDSIVASIIPSRHVI